MGWPIPVQTCRRFSLALFGSQLSKAILVHPLFWFARFIFPLPDSSFREQARPVRSCAPGFRSAPIFAATETFLQFASLAAASSEARVFFSFFSIS
jgi:hypothetical protein